MPNILLRTKLFAPPLRPSLVPRPRLQAKLDAGLDGKLTLISAPAGFGKTTLVIHWLQDQKRPAAWVSLDQNDDEPLIFFSYLLSAIQTIDPTLAIDLATSLRSADPPDETAIISALLNELAFNQEPFILVLDDYHAITHNAIHTALTSFIDYLPASIHLIITSREEPPLPLPRWRARGQLADINATDLRFTVYEAILFLNETMGLDLLETDVSSLEMRTEGWIAGLQLAALSLRNSDDPRRFIDEFVGSERQVADYLLQEVLLRQAEPVQNFLLQTSVLERFNAALCDALLDQQHSQQVLDEVEQSNLFMIPLDNSRYWYRFHHLFAQLLRYRLKREWPEESIADLHRRAMDWFVSQQLLEEAIAHAFQIPDHEAIARIIASLPLHYIYEDGGAMRIRQWVSRLPQSLMPRFPYVAALMAGASMLSGDVSVVYEYLQLINDDKTTQPYQDLYRSILVRNESGDHNQALHLAQQALAADSGQDAILAPLAQMQIAVNYCNLGQLEDADEAIMAMRHSIRGDDIAMVNMNLHAIELLVFNAIAQGNLFRAEQLCHEGIELAIQDQQSLSPLIGIMHTGLGNIYYQWNQMARVTYHLDIALDWARRTGISDTITYSLFLEANLACWRGDRGALETVLSKFKEHFYAVQMVRVREITERLTAGFWLRIGELESAVRWANGSDLTLDDEPAFHEFDSYHTLVAIRLAESRQLADETSVPSMLAMSDRLVNLAIPAHHVVGLIEALSLKALILDFQGHESALALIRQAMALAKPGNMLRLFLDWGLPMQQLLAKVITNQSGYEGQLLQSFDDEPKLITASSSSSGPAIQLTEREHEILQLIAAGLSNKQIQDTLFISKNTVRTHIKNLYSKLGVKSRTQAILQARELDLLS